MPPLADYSRPKTISSSELSLLAGGRPQAPNVVKAQRRKTWEISPTFHCSIIGTCLTAAELRQLIVKLGDADAKTASDHALHGRGVRAAGQRDIAGKLLNKALDRRHETVLKRFARLTTAAELRAMWNACLDEGEISGAYWAVISHPATDHALLQDVFGEVHMLSHLVGSSSRLDLARLRALQNEVAVKDEKIARQEERLRSSAEERSMLQRRIDALEDIVVRVNAVKASQAPEAAGAVEAAVLEKLEAARERTEALERRLAEAEAQLRAAAKREAAAAEDNAALLHENHGLEQAFSGVTEHGATQSMSLAGTVVLYVGGRKSLFDRLRSFAARAGVDLLFHDGGMEEATSLLPGLVAQSAVTVFPVDCVSHSAAGIVKRHCRDAGKPFLPLRSASLASFIAALGDISDLIAERDEADAPRRSASA